MIMERNTITPKLAVSLLLIYHLAAAARATSTLEIVFLERAAALPGCHKINVSGEVSKSLKACVFHLNLLARVRIPWAGYVVVGGVGLC